MQAPKVPNVGTEERKASERGVSEVSSKRTGARGDRKKAKKGLSQQLSAGELP